MKYEILHNGIIIISGLGITYFSVKFVSQYIRLYCDYMTRNYPRFFIYSFSLPMAFIGLKGFTDHYPHPTLNIIFKLICITGLVMSLLFMYFTWTKKFEVIFYNRLNSLEPDSEEKDGWQPFLINEKSRVEGVEKDGQSYYESIYESLKTKVSSMNPNDIYYVPTNVSLSSYHYTYYHREYFNRRILKLLNQNIDFYINLDDFVQNIELNKKYDNITTEVILKMFSESIFFSFQKNINERISSLNNLVNRYKIFEHFNPFVNDEDFNSFLFNMFFDNVKIVDNKVPGFEFGVDNIEDTFFKFYLRKVLFTIINNNDRIKKHDFYNEIKSLKEYQIMEGATYLASFINELKEIHDIYVKDSRSEESPKIEIKKSPREMKIFIEDLLEVKNDSQKKQIDVFINNVFKWDKKYGSLPNYGTTITFLNRKKVKMLSGFIYYIINRKEITSQNSQANKSFLEKLLLDELKDFNAPNIGLSNDLHKQFSTNHSLFIKKYSFEIRTLYRIFQ